MVIWSNLKFFDKSGDTVVVITSVEEDAKHEVIIRRWRFVYKVQFKVVSFTVEGVLGGGVPMELLKNVGSKSLVFGTSIESYTFFEVNLQGVLSCWFVQEALDCAEC
jgi:hypothetical protein